MARSRTTWTPEQARQMALAARASRERNRALRASIAAQPPPPPAPPSGQGSFSAELLTETRARLRDIADKLKGELARRKVDGATIDRLASALERLAELERRLDGRPLPGTRRPSDKPPALARPPAARPIGATRPSSSPASPSPAPELPSLTEPPDW